jgi:hypothetical protein
MRTAVEDHRTWYEIGIERRAGTTMKREISGSPDLGSRWWKH